MRATASDGRVVREVIERGGQARVRLLVAAEELLERRTLDGELQPEIVLLVVGGKGEAVEHSLTAVLEVANRRLGLGDCHQEGDSVLSRRSLGEQAERKLEPAGRTGGCSLRGGRPSFAQDGDRAEIAVPSGVLYVMGARGRRCALRRERVGAVLVGGEPHPGRAGLVHRVDGPADAESGTGAAPPPIAPDPGAASSSIASRASGSPRPAAASARSSSKGSPATAPASARRRAGTESPSSSRTMAATTALGTSPSSSAERKPRLLSPPASQLEHVERISSAPAIDAFGLRLIREAHEHLRVGGYQRAKRYRVDGFGSAQGGVHHRFGRVVGLSPREAPRPARHGARGGRLKRCEASSSDAPSAQ